MKRLIIFFAVALLMVGCAHSSVILFQPLPSDKSKAYPPTNPLDVGIYRSTNPFSSFTELGLISYRANDYDLTQMYNQLRKDSAEYGAEAVIDVKVTKETHTEWVPQTTCTPNTTCDASGMCTTDQQCTTNQVPVDVTTFLIVGSMIRGNK